MLGQAALGRLFYYLTLDKVKSCGILRFGKLVERLDMPTKTVAVEESFGNFSHLRCPCCDDLYLHQGIIEVYNRREDADNVRCVVVDGANVFSEELLNSHSNNPSDRRQGCIIHFDCENCEGIGLKLRIYQHKGNTLMDWVYEDGSNS